jgi:ATP/maltotriose-dependent transcriptional regulator MalT/DNA-binding SARP family transcriptional activator
MVNGKYAIPEVSDVVERDRLFSFLDLNRQKRVALILGQAAQGKSTLIASYLSIFQNKLKNQNQAQTLWLHLNKKESDHTKLFYMIFNAFSNVIEKSEYFKNLKIPQTTLGVGGVGENITRYSEILISLFNNIDKKINIVMDDLDSLDQNASSFTLIQNIIKEIPANISLFLLSRQMPLLSIEKLKMDKKVVVLNNEDLKFDLEETRMFFSRFDKTGKIDLVQIKKIQAVTEGWAGGLTLVSESMRRSPDLTKLPEHIVTDTFSFFSEEIYSSLPEHIKDFLIKTSFFETLDPEVLSKFCEDIPDPVRILKELARRNLFIQKVDSSDKWPVFRYNKLFRTFLKRALLRDISQEQFKELNMKAGRIFQEKKEHEQAVIYYIEAHAYKEIGKIIKTVGTDFVIKGRYDDLERWMKSLPNEMIWKDPWLIFYLTITRRIKGGVQNINDFRIALSLFEKTDDIRGQILCVAYLIEAAVFMRKPFYIILNLINDGKKLLESIDNNFLFAWARTLLWQQIGFGYIAGNGDILKGVSGCKNAIILAGKINNPDLKLNASIVMILGYVQAGDFTNAELVLSKIQDLTKEGIHPEYRALKNFVNIDFAMKKGEFKLSENLLSKAETDIEKFGFLFLYPGFLEAKSMYFIYTKNYKDADRITDYLSDFSILEGNNFYKGIAHGIKAVSLYHQAKYKTAEVEAIKALEIMEKTQRSEIHLFWVKQILGFIFFHQKKFQKAQIELQLCFDYFGRVSSDLAYAEASFALGLLLWEQNETEQAKSYIEIGVKKAVKENYVHFNVMSMNDFVKALFLIQVYGDNESYSEYILELLASNPTPLSFEIDSIKSVKTNKEKELLKLSNIYKFVLPKLRIETLGCFRILKDDLVVENINWEGVRPKLLLKSIVFHGGKDIPREVLIEDIWPESSTKAGEKNFKINLHRLRKALEPDVDQVFGYSYLIHKAGLVSFDSELVSIDTDEFLKFYLKGEQKEKSDQKEKAILFFDKAIRLYQGEYFVEEPYVEWLSARRNLFRIKYIEILERKACLHESLNQKTSVIDAWQRVLQADPLFEKAYQKLMLMYAGSGMKTNALNIFKECKNVFRQELDIDPDHETIKIYNQIQ